MSVRTLALGLALLLIAAVAATAQMTQNYGTATGHQAYGAAQMQPKTHPGTPQARLEQIRPMRMETPQTANVVINGVTQRFDPPALVSEGRVLVPLRGVFENLGTTVKWDASRQLVTITSSQSRAGPQASVEINTMQSSPVSMAQLEMPTSLQPSRSIPSAQTPSRRLVRTSKSSQTTRSHP